MKIAVDAMGGDNAPAVVVEGVERARDVLKTLNSTCSGIPSRFGPSLRTPPGLI